ncbi:thermosome subunit alpha [Salinarchaeum chitinilyticum]
MSESQQRRMGGQPMFVLNEDSSRTSGRDARQANISAGKAIAEAVRTTLGPRGMDKMLVSDGDVVITNDGATILEEMDIEHPAADMIVEVSQTQQEEVGDGTTTAAILTGRLLAQAEDLFDDDVHPTTIVEGYHRAAEIAAEAIEDIAIDAAVDEEVLRTVAESSMTGKGTGGVTAESLAEVVVDAVTQVRDGEDVARENITVHTQAGASSAATELVEGIVLDEEAANPQMPKTVEDASVAVLDVELGVRSGDVDAEYTVESVDQLTAAMEAEEGELKRHVETLQNAGVDVVFTTEDIDDRVAAQLGRAGILAFESLGGSDATAVANATGATRVGDLDDLEESDLGHVETVRTESYEDDDLAFVEGGAAAKAVTIFCRGGTEHVVDEVERAIEDALDVVTAAAETGEVVPGAGATEIAIADRVREESASVEGRKQLAVDAFADAMDAIPRTLAENAGADPIDTLVDLRARHESKGRAGLIAEDREAEVGDPVEHGVLDPATVKQEAVESATEASTMIVRIDDVISAE